MADIRKDAVAVAIAAGLFLVVAIIGFTPRYFGPLVAGDYVSPSSWMHLHVVSSLLWLLVFLLQPLLILRRKLARHRLIGRIGLVVAIVTAVTGIAIQIDLLPVAPGDVANLGAFTARFIGGLGVFIPAIVFAVIYRRRTAWHLRLMYLASMSLMPSPFGRIIIFYLGVPAEAASPMIGALNLTLAAVLPIYDKLVHGKVERISWLAFVAVALAGGLIGFLMGSPEWVSLLSN